VIVWVGEGEGHEAIGPPPPGVEVRPWPDDAAGAPERGAVEFAVPTSSTALGALDGLPALHVVQVLSAGVDWILGHVAPGVTLCDARGARDGAMAEWVLAAILADAKRARDVAERQARHEWERVAIGDVAGLRVLILGHGSIGRATARLLEVIGARVTGVARRARPEEDVRALTELSLLLGEADVLVNLLPLTSQTRGLVGAEVLRGLPEGALYVSAGRGATTDTGALLAALQAGRLRAVLDVVDPEPLPADHPLWDAPGLILSPHVAGDTPGAERAAWALVGAQLRRYVAGEPLENVVQGGY
jgi:phosphoglycerate dehydrogenase-like enzyme